MAPRKNTSGASYVKVKLQESEHMGKVEASAVTLLTECSAVLIRRLVAATPRPLSVANLKRTIENDDTFQCFRSALEDFQPVKVSSSFLSAHLKQQGQVASKKRPAAAQRNKTASQSAADKRKRAAASRTIIAVKAMEDVDRDFATKIEESLTGTRGHEFVEDNEDYD